MILIRIRLFYLNLWLVFLYLFYNLPQVFPHPSS